LGENWGVGLVIFVGIAFVLQIVLIFLIRVWWAVVSRFPDWLGWVSRIEFHA
jgi:hypothetical protein